MKSINKVLVIATVVLGLGTTASASANNSRIEDSLKQVIVNQSQHVTKQLYKQLKLSINIEVNEIAKLAALNAVEKNNNLLISKTNLINTTAEE